ncbi:MAG: glutaredoxin family protein [Methylococcales bacterium]|nr:glutaredoxin family protein [Methylococcales bacterium]
MKLILLGTLGCHLCEEAELILLHCKEVEIELIDIAEQEHWQEKYAIKIPVLYHSETKNELCWPFSLSDAQAFIKRIN